MKAAGAVLESKVVSLRPAAQSIATARAGVVVVLESIGDDGSLLVNDEAGRRMAADWLQTGTQAVQLASGDRLLAIFPPGARAVVLGRIGSYERPCLPKQVRVEAGESLSLRCGQSSLEMRADGKLMIRGEDVLVRARGTKRIKAGTVNIN